MTQKKKTVLVIALFVYVVLCGIIIADLGTCSVAGRKRGSIVEKIINSNSVLSTFYQWQGLPQD